MLLHCGRINYQFGRRLTRTVNLKTNRIVMLKRKSSQISKGPLSVEVDNQQTIFIFGDSNTWGFNPNGISGDEPLRFSRRQRWTTLVQNKLNATFKDQKYVIEVDALNARTTVHDDKMSPCEGQYNCNGRAIFLTSL